VPKHLEKEKPQKLKTGTDEADGPSPTENKPQEGSEPSKDAHLHARLAEAWTPESKAEKEEKKEEAQESGEKEGTHGSGQALKSQAGFLKQIKPALNAPNSPVHQQAQKKDSFAGMQHAQAAGSTGQTGQTRALVPSKSVAAVQAPQPAAPAKPARPPDAFSVLHAAQEPGVYFKEEGSHGRAEQQDPELSAAIEEAIRLLFGVRGILRVSGGFDQEQKPAIIVVATQGFGEASMKLVPPKVHRFETILAVPYDMLPLKRERL